MTFEQWLTILDRYGLAVLALIAMAAFLWTQGWPWFKEWMRQQDAERQAKDKRYEDQDARHRADLMAIIEKDNAYREKRLIADQQMAAAINGITEIVRQFGILEKIHAELATIKNK